MKHEKSALHANFRNSLRPLRFLALFRAFDEKPCFVPCYLLPVPCSLLPIPCSPVPKKTKNKKKLEIFYYICYNIIEEL